MPSSERWNKINGYDAHIDFRTVSHIIRGVRDENSGFGIDCANFFVVKLTISKNIPNFVKL